MLPRDLPAAQGDVSVLATVPPVPRPCCADPISRLLVERDEGKCVLYGVRMYEYSVRAGHRHVHVLRTSLFGRGRTVYLLYTYECEGS